MATTYRKIIKGYAHMDRPSGDWRHLGWMADRGTSKPVYELPDGTAVVIYDGTDHATIVVQEVDRSIILETPSEWFRAAPKTRECYERHTGSCYCADGKVVR